MVCIVLLAVAIWPVQYRIACTALVDTTLQRLVSTPFESTLLKTHVKPGDTVSRGDVLLELDGRPLRLERESIEAEIQQVVKTHDVALATRRIADAQQAAFKEQHLRRQYDLLSDRLQRLEVISPIDGIVVSGDLEKFVGSPLERGQTLIEVAPMNRMIIEIEIPAHEIGYVKKGDQTRLKIDAIGGKSIRVPLSEIFPAAEIRNDRNIFVGRIELDNPDQKLRPGMRGKATMYGPLRPRVWSWVHGGIERALWWIGY
jgi:multidrug efflux pump subunit AcrA (membrane-fusion protein)